MSVAKFVLWNPVSDCVSDSIKPVVLKQSRIQNKIITGAEKQLKTEIAPVICLLFEKTLQTGQLHSDWKKAQVFLSFFLSYSNGTIKF